MDLDNEADGEVEMYSRRFLRMTFRMEFHNGAKIVVTLRPREATICTNTHPSSMVQLPKHDIFGKGRSFGSQIAYSGHPVSDIRIEGRKA